MILKVTKDHSELLMREVSSAAAGIKTAAQDMKQLSSNISSPNEEKFASATKLLRDSSKLIYQPYISHLHLHFTWRKRAKW